MDLFGNEVIRTLGLHQPYASLMWTHDKIETRWVKKGKKPPFPLGKYVLYATKKIMDAGEVVRVSGPFIHDQRWPEDPRYLITGIPLVVADLVKVDDWTMEKNWDLGHKTFVMYDESETHRRVMLFFENKNRIKPFHLKGKQGVGILTPEQKAMIEYL
jgi:hypothetical protein